MAARPVETFHAKVCNLVGLGNKLVDGSRVVSYAVSYGPADGNDASESCILQYILHPSRLRTTFLWKGPRTPAAFVGWTFIIRFRVP